MTDRTASLAGALGQALAGIDGLSFFHLPDGIDFASAVDIVRAANIARPTAPSPFAILINAAASQQSAGSEVVVVSAKESVRYRQGDRLAVVYGRQPDLASFLQTFTEVAGPSYPDAANDRLGLREVARILLERLGAQAGLDTKPDNDAIEVLERCLGMLRVLHVADQQGVGSWNVRWFRHVESALRNLAEVFKTQVSEGSELGFSEFMERWCFASFGLPRPATVTKSAPSVVREVADAFHEYWADEDSLKQSLAQIAMRTDDPSFSAVTADGYNQAVLQTGDPKSGLVAWVAGSPERLDVLSRISVADFVDPSGTASDAYLTMDLVGRGNLRLTPDSLTTPFIVPLATDPLVGRRPTSAEIDILVSWTGPADTVVPLDLCGIDVVPKGAGAWETEGISVEPGQLRIRGRFHRPAGTGRNAAPFRAASVVLHVDRSHVLARGIPGKPGVKVYFLSAEEVLLIVAPVRKDGALGRPTVLEPSEEDLEPTVEVVPNEYGYQALLWHADAEAAVTLNGNPVPAHPVLSEVRTAQFSAGADNDFSAGDYTFRVRPVAAGKGQQSAIIAAALKEPISAERPSADVESSIRGQYEARLAEAVCLGDRDFLQSLGHVVMPSDLSCSLDGATPQWAGAVLMSNQTRALLQPHLMNLTFDDPFINGPEASRFREAFEALELPRLLGRQAGASSLGYEWPSRTSVRELWQDSRLDDYLMAYADLVRAASALPNHAMRFWAAYPFSLSVWDVKQGYHCSAVLLSPVHPVRLAWLAGSESVLDASARSRELLGTIEGWNFPVTGPGPKKNRHMIAIPSDAGEDQIFLGWSVLVPAGSDEGIALKSPARIGDYMAPGTAATGLNGASVDAALRSFRRMHPHATTLTVDLAASEPANRITEIDSAVLRMARDWSAKESFQGGIRVYDSVLRDGAPPRDDVTRMVRENRELLVTWSRYRHDPSRPIACNLRFLEGAGITARISVEGLAKGTVAEVPLRRFEAHGQSFGAYESPSFPAISGGIETPFVAALKQLEGGSPAIHSGMVSAFLADESADWTVLGETHITPAVMAGMMDQFGAGQKMLWEWRPPIFERVKDRAALIERRPHISIARVPEAFGHELEHLLVKAAGVISDSPAQKNSLKERVQRTLGRRGVGLASLLSLGGTHVAGALGFYLAFELFDRAPGRGASRLVIPVDAADYFLRVLAGGAEHGQDYRRADLLLLELGDEEVVISPVEIKSYGLKSAAGPAHKLPSAESSAFDDSLEQLASSLKVVKEIENTAGSLEDGADRALWFNALATLVETAIKLKPAADEQSATLSDRLDKVARGQMAVRAGRPILTYFDYLGDGSGASSYYSGRLGSRELGAVGMVADTRAVFAALEDPESALIESWNDLLDRSESPIHGDEPTLWQGQDDPSDEDHRENLTANMDPGEALTGQATGSPVTEREPGQSAGGIVGDGVRVNIGHALDSIGHAAVDFWPSNTGLTQMNVGIVGDLGTGKTEFVKALLSQIRSQAAERQPDESTSVLIFDYKGDFQHQEFLDRVGGVVLRPYRMPLNVFMPVTDEYSRKPHQQAGAFVDTLSKIYSGIGPVQASVLKKVIRDIFQGGREPLLSDVLDLYLEEQGKPDAVSSILETFVYGEIFDYHRENLRSFQELLTGRVLVVALDKLGQDQDAKNAIVALFLNLYYDHMIRSTKPPFQGSRPQLRYLKSFLVVDEAVNIMRYNFSVLMDLMLQGRQFGFGVMLSSQYLSHFDTGKLNYGEPLRTWVIHRVPSVSTKQLGNLGLKGVSDKTTDRIPAFDKHEVLYMSFGCAEPKIVRVTPYYELDRL
ncbi:ATP-binding protein [Sinomonas sp. R1AF57]|uniref:ATP-binding protein n=1 Tax=Sinomonas sp. R1AF57 TaxID=2020377 RepID=UPI001ABF5660|nr:type IV secretion system DNA-binding domain-containing protein [Sinomonas sp. R1AF57]